MTIAASLLLGQRLLQLRIEPCTERRVQGRQDVVRRRGRRCILTVSWTKAQFEQAEPGNSRSR
jgi:hypothetical protein